MFRFKPRTTSRPVRTAVQVAFALGILLGEFPIRAFAQEYVPPDLGLPGRREGGGTRGCWGNENRPATNAQLTALVPRQNFGYTLSPYPEFFLYVPRYYAEKAAQAEFILSDADDNELYRATFQTTNTAGVISIALPTNANLPPLEVDKDYHWSFALVCDSTDRSADLVVDSWVRLIEQPALTHELAGEDPEQRVERYAQAGIWYDALSTLASLHPVQSSSTLTSQWTNLLSSVGLDQIAREPDVSCIESVDLNQSGTPR